MDHQNKANEFRVRVPMLGKVVLYVTTLLFISVAISTYFAVKTELKILKEGLVHTVKHKAHNIAFSTESAFWSFNWLFLERMLKEFIQSEFNEIIYSKVVKPNGEVYLASDRGYYGEMIDSSLLSNREALIDNYFFPEKKEYGMLLSYPVTIQDEVWHIILGLSLEPVHRGLKGLVYHNIAWASFVVLLGIVGSFFLSKSISKPIIQLTKAAKLISDGNLDHNVIISSKDEVGLLSRSFNQMIENIKNAEKELRRAHSELEQRVEERTVELAQANKELEAEIAERRQAEEQLKHYADELEKINQELQQFAFIASHDLQEPLRMVASYTQLLGRRYKGKLDPDADEFIAYAVDGATRMQDLINGLLSYSRVGTHGKDFEPTDCGIILDLALKNLQKTIDESGARITRNPLPTVMSDKVHLCQLFQNLISNAIKFRNEDQPRIHVSANQKGDEWVFSIRDNGIGIDPEFAEQIFIIFQQLHTRGEYPGTGIGLAICKKIVERYGGRIWVESEPGKGSTFWFTIPMRGENSHA